jgi:hypothetical protein
MSDIDYRRRRTLKARMRDPEYRQEFSRAHALTVFAFQIVAMRQDRCWTLKDLSARSGLSMRRLRAIEFRDRFPSARDLFRLAAAFDVAAIVRFVPFSDALDRVGTASMPVLSFREDPEMEGE